MRYATPLPVDKNGNPIPVFIPNTAKTQALGIADATTVASISPRFSTTTKSVPYLTLDKCADADTITFKSKVDPYISGKITIEFDKDGASLAVTVTSYAIKIAYNGGASTSPTCAEVAAAIAAHEVASKLIYVEYTTSTALLDDADVAATHLGGYEDGETPMVVRIYPTEACMIHVGPEVAANAAGCTMPLAANVAEFIALMPDEYISVVGLATVTGAKAYITPARRF